MNYLWCYLIILRALCDTNVIVDYHLTYSRYDAIANGVPIMILRYVYSGVANSDRWRGMN